MAMVVMAQVANATHTVSVGEKRWPLPLLSVGASVSTTVPLCKWVHSHLKSPLYATVAVIIVFLRKFIQVKPIHEENNFAFMVYGPCAATNGTTH
jgi:hypothetical protein